MNELIQPESWAPDYKLPRMYSSQLDAIYISLQESLFHMDDIQAEQIKDKYLEAYPFVDAKLIEKW